MIFDLTANTNRRKLMVLDPSYPKDVSTTVIKGNTTSATFSVVITEPGSPDEYTYQWYVNGSAVSGANSASYTRTGLSATATYSVYCEVTNKAGTVKSRVATLKVTQYYTPTLNSGYPANASVVKGNSITSKVVISTAGNPSSYTYQWYKNGTKVSGATSASYTFTPTEIGTTTLYCKVTNTAGTVTSRTATITATGLYLYNAGDKCESVTGGWKAVNLSGYFTFNNTNIVFGVTGSSNQHALLCTEDKIDLSKFSTLKALVDVTKDGGSGNYNYYCSVGITSNNTDANQKPAAYAGADGTGAQMTLSLDISSFGEGYYVCFRNTLSAGTIYKIWLE